MTCWTRIFFGTWNVLDLSYILLHLGQRYVAGKPKCHHFTWTLKNWETTGVVIAVQEGKYSFFCLSTLFWHWWCLWWTFCLTHWNYKILTSVRGSEKCEAREACKAWQRVMWGIAARHARHERQESLIQIKRLTASYLKLKRRRRTNFLKCFYHLVNWYFLFKEFNING